MKGKFYFILLGTLTFFFVMVAIRSKVYIGADGERVKQ